MSFRTQNRHSVAFRMRRSLRRMRSALAEEFLRLARSLDPQLGSMA